MLVYERAILKTFPQLDKVADGLRCAVYKKAVSSFGDLRPTESIANELLMKIHKRSMIAELKSAVEESLTKIKPCYAYYLSVQYGIGNLTPQLNEVKDRNFYRKVALSIKKFSEEMNSLGFTDRIYEKYVKAFPFIKAEYDKANSFNEKIRQNERFTCKGRSFKPNTSKK
ncbi:MAG: hypothetical protein E7360_05825 [Clostridiales bacterium]|nr:hypothetical protein [Clostridiales bacterium]